MKTKPFNLEQALAGKKVVTRDGRTVTEIFAFKSPLLYPIRYIVDGIVHSAMKNDGISYNGTRTDLFMEVETKTYYRNSWTSEYRSTIEAKYHSSEEKAKDAAKINDKSRYFEIAVPVEVEIE